MELPCSGTCQCGGVTYTVSEEPLVTYACHCTECQKRTGSAFSMGMVFSSGSIKFEGELASWTRASDLGNENTRYSCKKCGNNIYGIGSNIPGLLKLQPGTLDSTQNVRPDAHFWISSAQFWFQFPSNMPVYDKQPSDAAQVFDDIQKFREKDEQS